MSISSSLSRTGVAAWYERRSRRRRSSRGADASLAIGVAIIGIMMLAALLAGVLSPADPIRQDIPNALAPPGTDGHPLGTDALGRDVLTRMLYAARTDLFVAVGAVLLPLAIGVAVGTIAGYRGGIVDRVVTGVVNVVFAFPVMVLLIALVFILGPGIPTIIVAVTLVSWVSYARLARDLVRRERSMDYVLAAKVSGLPTRRILGRHILRNIIAQPVTFAMSDAVAIILFITALGFLGLGVPPPAPDWGTMIADAQPYFTTHWWLAVFPGLAICAAGLGLSLIADGLSQKWNAQ
ncbi:ABC transporter permease [Jiangella muralis]|uniref:ABC transporter permease n=1 Tax=Jiangella muralis TaxID=702383 RepID=UPI00069F5D30|nr:ABC transporter permease [Jiangella muralis]